VARKLTKRALAETSVEASPAEVARTIEEIFGIIEIFLNARTSMKRRDGLNYMESAAT
jgi:hypothetical protein